MVNTTEFSGTIQDTNTETLLVSTAASDAVQVLIDDGALGNTPAQYTIQHNTYSPGLDRFQFYQDATGETSRSWRFEAVGPKTQIEVTNTSGSDAQFDITVIARSYGE